MKHALLLFALILSITTLSGQNRQQFAAAGSDVELRVFPNPATDFISLNEVRGIQQVQVFNLAGRKVKTFQVINRDQRYDVSQLPKGVYLVQIINDRSQIVVTRRLSKR